MVVVKINPIFSLERGGNVGGGGLRMFEAVLLALWFICESHLAKSLVEGIVFGALRLVESPPFEFEYELVGLLLVEAVRPTNVHDFG